MEFGKCIQSENSTTQNVKVKTWKHDGEMIFNQQKSEN